MTEAVRVHLADDHVMFREGIAAILASRGGIDVVSRTGTGEEAIAAVGRTRPDVVITQLEMNLKDARETLSGIRSASPDSRIVVLTMLDNPRYMSALSKMGIDAYVHKSSSAEDLLAIVETMSRARGPERGGLRAPRAARAPRG